MKTNPIIKDLFCENIEIWFIVSYNFTAVGLVFTKLGINVIINDTCVVSEKSTQIL